MSAKILFDSFEALPDYNLRSTPMRDTISIVVYELDMPVGEGVLHPHFPGGATAGLGR